MWSYSKYRVILTDILTIISLSELRALRAFALNPAKFRRIYFVERLLLH